MASYCCMVVFVLVIQPLCSLAVAPTDRHGICRTDHNYRQAHDWIPYANDSSSGTWKVLIDQYDYQNLLGASLPPGVWSSKDVDGDGRQIIQQGGQTCTYQLKANSYTNSNSTNWVFTQAVDYLDAVEVIVNATVRFSGCTERPDCTNDFVILHRYDTNLPNEMQRKNQANYQPFLGDLDSSRLQQGSGSVSTNIVRRFIRPQNFNYTYFGLRDIGTTGTIGRIFVYYEVCPSKAEGLVIYPEVPYPSQGSSSPITRTAQCAEYAHNTSSLETFAYSGGRCVQSATCVCDLGYAEESSGSQCTPCNAGEYKSTENSSCVVCPANSTSTQASGSCSCVDGQFRYTNEGIGVKCTAPPSPISECTSNIVYDTGAVLQWRSPSHCGGRNDCYYRITINNGPPIRYDPPNFNFNVQETYTVNNLQPDTTYSIIISVHNNVSDQDADNAKLRECSVVVTTIPGSVFMLGGITYLNNSAVVIEDIGEGEMNSLKCTTASETCCRNSRQGNFYYPNNDPVTIESEAMLSIYRTRNSGSISLNKQNDEPIPLGRYRCEIPDGRGNLQNLYIKIGTTLTNSCLWPTTCNGTTFPRVVAVVDEVVVMDISVADLSNIDEFEVKIFTVGETKRQTKELVTFTVESTWQPWVKIPSDKLNTLTKGSTYSVQIKTSTQGQYGPAFTFQFTGKDYDISDPESVKFLALSTVATFAITSVVATLLVLVLVCLFRTCKKKKSTKYTTKNGSDKPLELKNPSFEKSN